MLKPHTAAGLQELQLQLADDPNHLHTHSRWLHMPSPTRWWQCFFGHPTARPSERLLTARPPKPQGGSRERRVARPRAPSKQVPPLPASIPSTHRHDATAHLTEAQRQIFAELVRLKIKEEL